MDSNQHFKENLAAMLKNGEMFKILDDKDREKALAILIEDISPVYFETVNISENDFLEYMRALKNGEAREAEFFFLDQDSIVGQAQDGITMQMNEDVTTAVVNLAENLPELARFWKRHFEEFDIQDAAADELLEELREFGVSQENISFESDDFRCGILLGSEAPEGSDERAAVGALSDLYRDGDLLPEHLSEALSRSGLAFLLESQGYSFQDLMSEKESVFLDSVRMELEENFSNASAAIALRLNINNAKDLFSENGMILSPKYGGLFDSINGSGGTFEIRFEKPVHVNREMIADVHVEGASENYGSSIDEVYGMSGFVWNCDIKKAQEPPRPFVGIPIDGVAVKTENPAP